MLQLHRGVAMTLVALVVTLLPTSTSTAHTASTCHGHPATIEASTGTVTGTPGDDVIVVTGFVKSVDAGDGDDLVCVVDTRKLGGPNAWLRIDPGAGDDEVDASEAGAKSTTNLGLGADTFTGSEYREAIQVGTFPQTGTAPGDPGPDVVRTGAGKDGLAVRAGATVDADLGSGPDTLGFEGDFYVAHAYAGPDSHFDLGAGRDRAVFNDQWETPGAYATSLRVDFRSGSMTWHDATSSLQGLEDIYGAAQRIVLRGNDRANTFYVRGCDVVLRGRAGDDSLTMDRWAFETGPASCPGKRGHRAYGSSGDDHLRGGPWHDVLIGGPGYDMADGSRSGHDRCEAERTWGKGCNP
jgi:hypothetical protein